MPGGKSPGRGFCLLGRSSAHSQVARLIRPERTDDVINHSLQGSHMERVHMALEAGGKRFCKFVWVECGKGVLRRVGEMVLQFPDGRLKRLTGDDLPDVICLFTGQSEETGGLLQVIDHPDGQVARKVNRGGASFLDALTGTTVREAFFFILGMCVVAIAVLVMFSAWLNLHRLR
jgi:hypothetical protein